MSDIRVWRFNSPEMAEHNWVAVADPESFSTRDLNRPKFCIRPLIPDLPRHNGTLGLAGWLEEFELGPFERHTGEAVLVTADDKFFLKVRGIDQSWDLTYTELFNALDSFASLIGEVRRKAVGREQAMGTFVGRDLNYENPYSATFLAEEYERGEERLNRQLEKTVQGQKRYGPEHWGNWS